MTNVRARAVVVAAALLSCARHAAPKETASVVVVLSPPDAGKPSDASATETNREAEERIRDILDEIDQALAEFAPLLGHDAPFAGQWARCEGGVVSDLRDLLANAQQAQATLFVDRDEAITRGRILRGLNDPFGHAHPDKAAASAEFDQFVERTHAHIPALLQKARALRQSILANCSP